MFQKSKVGQQLDSQSAPLSTQTDIPDTKALGPAATKKAKELLNNWTHTLRDTCTDSDVFESKIIFCLYRYILSVGETLPFVLQSY